MRRVYKLQRRNAVFCLKGVSLHIGVTCDTILEALSLASLNHATWNPSPAKPAPSRVVYGGPCVQGATALTPRPCPSDVNNIVFVTFDFESVHFVTDLALFLSALASFFCFLLGDEESCAFSFNKQTAVWINKLKGSGCGPVRTVCSVSLSVCLSCKWARGAPRLNCIAPKPAHNGLPHINRLVSLVQHRHCFSPATFVSYI